ncbi:MAG: zinc ABC transporter substrate-binding protein [bacterium]
MADVPKVVTDFGPIQSLVMDVMGDLGTPDALLPSGGDPHEFQLRPSQAQMLAGADLVFWDGPELMPALADALTSLAPQARVVSLLHDSGGRVRLFADGGTDPHGWLDPVNGILWAGKIAEVLAARDPVHAAVYADNARALQASIAALDLQLMAAMTPLQTKPFVVYHDALGYFTDHYRLDVAGAIELGDASGPSAARLAEIRGLIAGSSAVCVFPEIGRDPKFIAALTGGEPVRTGQPQDFEFIAMAPGRGQYQAMLQGVADTITECLNRP